MEVRFLKGSLVNYKKWCEVHPDLTEAALFFDVNTRKIYCNGQAFDSSFKVDDQVEVEETTGNGIHHLSYSFYTEDGGKVTLSETSIPALNDDLSISDYGNSHGGLMSVKDKLMVEGLAKALKVNVDTIYTYTDPDGVEYKCKKNDDEFSYSYYREEDDGSGMTVITEETVPYYYIAPNGGMVQVYPDPNYPGKYYYVHSYEDDDGLTHTVTTVLDQDKVTFNYGVSSIQKLVTNNTLFDSLYWWDLENE